MIDASVLNAAWASASTSITHFSLNLALYTYANSHWVVVKMSCLAKEISKELWTFTDFTEEPGLVLNTHTLAYDYMWLRFHVIWHLVLGSRLTDIFRLKPLLHATKVNKSFKQKEWNIIQWMVDYTFYLVQWHNNSILLLKKKPSVPLALHIPSWCYYKVNINCTIDKRIWSLMGLWTIAMQAEIRCTNL